MYKYFKDLKSIRYPVYPLKTSDWYRQDGVLFTGEGLVLDDTNMPGASLGIRRLQCGRKDLCRLKKAYIDYQSMLMSKRKIFIDSNGIPFIYEKTINSPLIYHKVAKIEYRNSHSLIWLKNIPCSFSIPRPPYGNASWARVLYYKGGPWLLLDFASERGKDSYRRV